MTVNGALDVDQYPLPNPSEFVLHLLVARNLLNLTNVQELRSLLGH